jgi:hypothetical protein
VRVWLAHYRSEGGVAINAKFLLFTTGAISQGSFLVNFTGADVDGGERARVAVHALAKSQSKELAKVKAEVFDLSAEETADFFARITIFPDSPRIDDIPELINRRLITVRRQSRQDLFERLEGWWLNQIIEVLTGKRMEPIRVQEVTDKLAILADEYKIDNLPITFGDRLPEGGVDAHNDPRLFVGQLRTLNLSAERIQFAIIDYYRAFEQRSQWARANLLVSNEIEKYEDKLVDEWARYREFALENITDESGGDACVSAGRELYRWAEQSTGQLRIRERVAEPYVIRGSFHILANGRPNPRIHWHPHFMKRLAELLGVAA